MDWGGAFWILDGLSVIGDSEFDILEDILLLGVGVWLFRGYLCILDGDYAFWDDYLVF